MLQARHPHHQHTAAQSRPGQQPYQPRRLLFERRPFLHQTFKCTANAPHLTARTGGRHACQSVALHHQRARKQAGQVLAPGTRQGRTRQLAHRHRLPREQRLVHLQARAAEQHGVCRYALAFGQPQQIALHHLGTRNAHGLAVAQHTGARAAEVAQSLHGAFGAARLKQGQAQHRQHQGQHDQALLQITQQQIQQPGCQQQHEHGLLQSLAHDGAQVAPRLARHTVGAVVLQALGGLGGA